MAFMFMPVFTPAVSAAYVGSGGTGGAGDPFLISNRADLEELRDYINENTTYTGQYFQLTTDIDLGGEENPWTPIGGLFNYPFKGTFDGNGHTINGLYIHDGTTYIGLFGYVSGGTVKNLNLNGSIDAAFSSALYVGGIAAANEGTIENCRNAADISGNTSVGGIAGMNSTGTIKNCSNSGSITSTGSASEDSGAGGIVGYNSYIAENCYNTGKINATDGKSPAGGVAGINTSDEGSAVIKNCYNTGSVTSAVSDRTIGAGGVAGNNASKVQNCYSTGKVTVTEGSLSPAGGIVGRNNTSAGTGAVEVTNCYYLSGMAKKGIGNDVVSAPPSADSAAKEADAFETLAETLNGGGSAWENNEFLKRPTLTENSEFSGKGTKDAPYLITNAVIFEIIRDHINNGNGGEDEYFKLTTNIDLGGSDEKTWTPIKDFKGNFNGGGYKISGLYINSGEEQTGLFAVIDQKGSVENLGVEGTVSGSEYVGGIAGTCSGTIKNCYNAANVSGGVNCGGIAGGFSDGSIENCYNTGIINSSEPNAKIGGIVGSNSSLTSGTIKNCYNAGNIGADGSPSGAGGIAGESPSSAIENCYYLKDTAENGIGGGDDASAAVKTNEEFLSGSVAWLLQNSQDTQYWGQKLGTDNYPLLTNVDEKKVCKVTFTTVDDENYDTRYANYGKNVKLPETPPEKEGYTFEKWSQSDDASDDELDEKTPITGDITAHAVGRELFGSKNDAADITATYGYKEDLTFNLDELMAYQTGTDGKGKFTYSIATDEKGTNARISDSELKVPSLDAGDYTITVKATETTPQYSLMSIGDYGTDDVTLTVNVKIAKADPTVNVEAEDLTYNGGMQNLLSGTTSGGTLKYSSSEDGEYTDTVPQGKEAGDYEVWYKVEGDKNFNGTEARKAENVNIKKATPEVTAPKPNTLVYDDTEQPLVQKGETSGGEMQYSLDDNVYSTDIPKGKDAMDYTVYYKVVGDSNYNDVEADSITVTIAKSNPILTAAPAAKTDLVYTGGALELVTAGTASGGKVMYSKDNIEYSYDIPTATDADTYTVWYKVEGDKNHNDLAPVSITDITVEKADPEAIVTANDMTYNGEEQDLVTATVTGGKLLYSSTREGAYTETLPHAKEANEYEIWYKVEGDKNHNDTEPQSLTATIKKAYSTVASDGGETCYGDTVTLTAEVSKAPSALFSISAAKDKVDFYLGMTPLGSATVEYDGPLDESGTATLDVTADKKFMIGENTIRAEYGGSVNLNGSENNEITFTMNQRPLLYTVSASGKVYDGNASVDVTLDPINKVGDDDVTLDAVGTVSSADAGEYADVDLTDVTVSGNHGKYYTVDKSADNVTLDEQITITQAEGEASVTMNDYVCGDDSVNPVPASDTNDINNVTYTYSVKDADDYDTTKPLLAGDAAAGTEYTVKAVFAETKNYKAVTVTDDFKVTHNWDEWTITEDPSRETEGSAQRDCLSRDNTESDVTAVPKLANETVWTKGKYVKPTPEKEGLQVYVSEYGTVTEIIPKLIVQSIRIVSEPTNTTVTEGMTLDISGLSVEAVYSDDSTADITSDCKLTYDTSNVGEQSVTVEYGDKNEQFKINVVQKTIIGISITKKPDKRVYNTGDSLDTTGMVVTALFNNGTESEITVGYEVSGYSPQSVGTQTITVSYGGFTGEFTVTVTEPTTPEGTVETPVIETSGFYGGKTVTLSDATDGALIYYTLDGSAPTISSTLYTAPFNVTETTVVKAAAVKDGMEQSRAASGKISVTKAEKPAASIPSGEVEAGTLITLQSETTGADIYYTTNGETPTIENGTLYDGFAAINENVTVKAIAVKNGYAASDVTEISYTVKAQEENIINLSVGTAFGKIGDTVYIPVYVRSSSDISAYRFTLTFDKTKFAYASVAAADEETRSSIFTSIRDGSVTVLRNGGTIQNGEICRIGFKVLDGASDGEYDITVSDDHITAENVYSEVRAANGKIILSSPDDVKVTADAVITDADGNTVDKDSARGSIDASVAIDEAEGVSGEPVIANIILAVYDRNNELVSIDTSQADLSDTSFIFRRTLNIPEGVSVGSLKLMIWNGLGDGMSPLAPASKML